MRRISLLSEELSDSQEAFCPMELVGRSVGWSVGRLVGRSVGGSVSGSVGRLVG